MFTTRILQFANKKSLKVIKQIKKLDVNQEYSTNFSNNDENKDNFSIFNVKKSLRLADVDFHEGPTNLKINSCPVCTCDEKNKIYINKTTGYFICPSCQYSGKYGIIEKFIIASKSQKARNELKTYTKLFLDSKQAFQDANTFSVEFYERNSVPVTSENAHLVYDYFQIHDKISISSLVALKSRFNETDKELLFPLLDVENKTVGYKILSINRMHDLEEVCERTVPENNCSGVALFTNSKTSSSFNKSLSSTKAILVLNILDLLALTQTKIQATFICLPHGLKSLPQECLPTLDCYQELLLWFNYDTAGWDVARNFAKKLDEKRCLFVRPTSSYPTPYKALVNNQDIKMIFNAAQPILHKAITTFSSLRQDVLSDLQNIDKVQGVKWKRYPLLNKYLKGHRKGELTVLTGPTGSGKTTFISDYSLDLATQGVNTLFGSFEIRNTRLATTLLRQFAGKPLLESHRNEDLVEFEHWANLFEQLPIYFMTFHGEQQIKVVMEAIEHAQYVHDINHVIIDNVQFMMGISDEPKHIDRFWKQDVIIASFRTFATRKNCHVTLVIHPRKEKDSDDLTTSSIFGGAKATQEADNVLIIQDKRLTSMRGKKYLQIAKNRFSGDLGIMPLDFDKLSLSYAHKPKKKLPSEDASNVVPDNIVKSEPSD